MTAGDVSASGGSIAVSARYTVTIDYPEEKADLVINENESGLYANRCRVLERLALAHPWPLFAPHDDLAIGTENLVPGERSNGHSHRWVWVATHPELSIPIVAGRLYLGRW
jgi:thiamine phosphate synthase YjbQ (UPF0047 family)